MRTKLYIGSDLADFNEAFNVMFSIGDIRELSFGNCNKSYTLNLPLTKTNRRLLKHINQADVKSEPSGTGRLYLGELLVISGIVKVLGYTDTHAKVIIDSDEWIDALKGKKMTELDLSAYDHVLSNVNLLNSWTAEDPVFRYPMIYFGSLISGQSGASAAWSPADFIPMVSLARLMTKILSPYTISSSWIGTAFIKNLFILCRESIANADFIKNKQLTASIANVSANDQTGVIPAEDSFSLGASWIPIMDESTDEGADFDGSYRYTVPETGTYRFTLSLTAKSNEAELLGLTVSNRIFEISIVKGATVLATVNTTAEFNGVTLSITTDLVHCEASDVINAYVSILTQGSSTNGDPQNLIYGLSAGSFANIWGEANRYTGVGKTISLEEMMPDMTQSDFLAAIRDIFNLRFWMDKMKRTIYIEPWDSFLSSTVVDLTSLVDHDSFSTEIISESYFKNIRLKWKEDSSDYAHKDYLKYNTIGPGSKDITMSSLFVKKGIDIKEHPFSSIITGYNRTIGDLSTPVPMILDNEPISPYIIFGRKTGFNTRIVEWKGLTAGFTWTYGTESRATYPKIQGLDFASLYTSYWMKLLHYADKGKILTCKARMTPTMIAQFFTVVATASSEGFRVCYQIDKNYYFLQRITTDGITAELELVLKC